jgi:lysozyme
MPKPLVIDLSHHQVIPKDLSGAADAGIAAVIHKATENVVVSDAKAKARKALAEDAGLLWGIYHFMRPGHIRNQADAFLSKTDLIDDDTLLVCDFEVNGITLDELLEFLTRVEAKSGQKPVLYSGNTLKELGGASTHRELADYRLWIAQYNNKGPTLPKGYKDWWLWQYSDRGKVAGINGSVDVNAYQGTARDLRQNWVIRHSAATASATHESPLVGKTSDSSTGNLTDKAGAADAPTQALNQTIVDVPPVKTEATGKSSGNSRR